MIYLSHVVVRDLVNAKINEKKYEGLLNPDEFIDLVKKYKSDLNVDYMNNPNTLNSFNSLTPTVKNDGNLIMVENSEKNERIMERGNFNVSLNDSGRNNNIQSKKDSIKSNNEIYDSNIKAESMNIDSITGNYLNEENSGCNVQNNNDIEMN